ncbi:hypothetical protein [Streptosporangium sp. NPDC051022]|uniref:hypothetical protein n=1 Tax=Streptosporangium sp. NPDC051022 TaxID=3155752 RepID=UPI003418477A
MTDINDWNDDRRPYDDSPEPPEEPPLNLDDVAKHYHKALAEDMTGIPKHSAEALAAVPELLARLRFAEAEVERLRNLPRTYQYAVTKGSPPTARTRPVTREEAEAAWRQPNRVPWVQTHITDPWGVMEEPPF